VFHGPGYIFTFLLSLAILIRAAFERAERDLPPAPVMSERPRPVLKGGDAVRVLELA
jgi:hypothetical protein